MKHKKYLYYILIYFILFCFTFATLFPFFIMLTSSLKEKNEIVESPPNWFPKEWKFKNYIEIFQQSDILRYLLNSFFIGITSSLVTLIFAFPAAYACARFKFKFRGAFLYIILVTQMISPVMLVIGMYRTFVVLGLIDTYWSLIIINSSFDITFALWLLTGYIKAIPVEIEEAAAIDGCTRLDMFLKILFPIAAPGIAVALLFSFISCWSEFLIAYTFVSKTNLKTVTLGLYDWVGKYTIEWHWLMATSVVVILPVLIMFIFIQKYIIKGLTIGAYR